MTVVKILTVWPLFWYMTVAWPMLMPVSRLSVTTRASHRHYHVANIMAGKSSGGHHSVHRLVTSSPFGFSSSTTTSRRMAAAATTSSNNGSNSSSANLFRKLPWNAKKEKQREARRLKQERAVLHRELGIAEDATYEDIVEATDALIARAGNDLKRKVQIEVVKDKILQIRLNERLAGLAAQTKEARAQSFYEIDGYATLVFVHHSSLSLTHTHTRSLSAWPYFLRYAKNTFCSVLCPRFLPIAFIILNKI